MEYKPHNYQAYCIERIVNDPAVGLFLRPGLGKTSITLSAINILKYFKWNIAKALVVAPKKVAEGIIKLIYYAVHLVLKHPGGNACLG